MMEGILGREFKMNPESFAKVIQRAIAEAIDNDDFSIRVNPDQQKQIHAFMEGPLSEKMVPDETIHEGNFRIESDHKVIDGNASKLIGDLLNQADIQLFKDDSEAS